MSISKEKVEQITKEYGKKNEDSGSTKVQIAIWTERINVLTEHLKKNKKDHSTRRGLIKLVSKRRNMLKYLKNNSMNEYKDLLNKLNIRK